MDRIAFYQLPLWVRVAAALTLFNTWVLIAEFVIDQYGFDKYLLLYRYANILCVGHRRGTGNCSVFLQNFATTA